MAKGAQKASATADTEENAPKKLKKTNKQATKAAEKRATKAAEKRAAQALEALSDDENEDDEDGVTPDGLPDIK